MRRILPTELVAAAMVLQAVAGLALGLPGHLSSDSIVQLYEARTLHFVSFHPPMMSLLLRVLDGWVRGTALFVVLDQLLLTASFALLLAQRKSELRWPAAIAAALVVLNPLLIAYTGIVWKDVLMAHLAAFGYVCLYVAARQSVAGKRTVWAFAAVVVLAGAASLRQHALVLAIPGTVYAAFMLSHGRVTRWGLAFVFSAVVVGINVAIVAYADAVAVGEKISRTRVGLRTLVDFDLAGIAAHGGVIPDVAIAAQVGSALVPSYTPSQIGTQPDPVAGSPLWRMETPELLALWSRSILNSPKAYLAHRAAHLANLLWQPCLLMFSGVRPTVYVPSLDRDIVPELGLAGRWNLRDRRLMERLDQLRDTPLFNHVFWAAVVMASGVALWLRGGGGLPLLAAGAVAFALGFGVIGVACDFRYLYILPVAATILLFALAVTSSAATDEPASGSANRDTLRNG